jgi:predicted ester cyclase
MFVSPEQIAHRYYELFNARRLDDTERLIDPEALFHYPSFEHDLVGPAGHRALSQIWLIAFPDLELQILRSRSNGDHTVIMDSVARGTHEGPLYLGIINLAATGRHMRIEFEHVLRLREARIMDVSLNLDLKELVRYLTIG